MKRITLLILTAAAAAMIAACGAPAENKPAANSPVANTNTAPPASSAPTKEALLALENKAYEAYKNKDGKFFEGLLTDNFVMYGPQGRLDKAATVKMIAEHKCTVNSYAFSDESVTPAGADAAVLTAKITSDIICDGKKQPSPVTMASVYVRDGAVWKAATHNEVAITDPKDMKPRASKPAPPPAGPKKPETLATAGLTNYEKKGWEAWKARDKDGLDKLTVEGLTIVDMFGKVTTGKSAVMGVWLGPKCDIKTVAVTDSEGVPLTRDAAILTYKGTATGTCDGQPLGSLWGTSVFIKDGPVDWKLVYSFEIAA